MNTSVSTATIPAHHPWNIQLKPGEKKHLHSKLIGPLLAGALIASVGSVWVFLLNAVLSTVSAVIISRWKREHRPHHLGRERLISAMRIGLQYVSQSYHLKGVLLRIAIFFFTSTGLLALLPLVVPRARHRGDQGGGRGPRGRQPADTPAHRVADEDAGPARDCGAQHDGSRRARRREDRCPEADGPAWRARRAPAPTLASTLQTRSANSSRKVRRST